MTVIDAHHYLWNRRRGTCGWLVGFDPIRPPVADVRLDTPVLKALP